MCLNALWEFVSKFIHKNSLTHQPEISRVLTNTEFHHWNQFFGVFERVDSKNLNNFSFKKNSIEFITLNQPINYFNPKLLQLHSESSHKIAFSNRVEFQFSEPTLNEHWKLEQIPILHKKYYAGHKIDVGKIPDFFTVCDKGRQVFILLSSSRGRICKNNCTNAKG